MPWVYSVLTVIIGLFFYWLRSNRRVWYGFSEILVAFGLVYVTYFLHGAWLLSLLLTCHRQFWTR